MTVVVVIVAPFFTVIIIVTWQVVRASRPSNLVDSPERVDVLNLSPFVAGMWATRCRRGRRGWSYNRRRWRSDWRRLDLHLLHGRGGEAVEASGPGDLADGEPEAVRHDREVEDDDHLARLGSCTHTPYLARHCRQNMVSSLPKGMPKVVDCRQTGAQATNYMVTQDTDKDFI